MASVQSSASSKITGDNYVKGFRAGFLQRNGNLAEEFLSEFEVKDRLNNTVLGDIDIVYNIKITCLVTSVSCGCIGTIR